MPGPIRARSEVPFLLNASRLGATMSLDVELQNIWRQGTPELMQRSGFQNYWGGGRAVVPSSETSQKADVLKVNEMQPRLRLGPA